MKKTAKKKPLVTVYTVCYNYGRFLSQAIESVINQSFKDWELLIFDDGSKDNTAEVAARYAHYPNISFFRQENQGLIRTANQAIEKAQGKYIMRLDADDYLDENALLLMVQMMKTQPDLALVYPDYFVVNEENVILEHVHHNRITEASQVLDLPAHGACSLVKKSVMLEINKYDKTNPCQDGYDLWLKLVGRNHKIKNANLPLFYYRSHGQNMTTQEHRILDARQKIKEKFVRNNMKADKKPEVLAIIPTRGTKANAYVNPLREIAGKKLIEHTLDAAAGSEMISRTVVLSEDDETLEHVRKKYPVETMQRPARMGGLTARIEESILWVLEQLQKKEKYTPDLVLLLYIHTPLRKTSHIDEAIYSQMIFKTDSVITVTQNTKFLYRHSEHGMIPLYKKRLLRHQKDVLYEEVGAIELSRASVISKDNFLGKTIGHVLMGPRDSVQITNEFEFWMCEQVLNERAQVETIKLGEKS